MRKKIVAGNWKMNLLKKEAKDLFQNISNQIDDSSACEIMVFAPALFVPTLVSMDSKVKVGFQNFYPADKGAFTGEISITQVQDSGATHVLVGHSERRALFNEDHLFLKEKVNAAIEKGINVIFCCGEPLNIREEGEELNFVKQQLVDSLFHLDETKLKKCVIAYEPVWAIGTGKTASIQQAEDMHKSIRSWVEECYGLEAANSISVLYGGSCNAANAKDLFACPNVDGGLIGGAALDADSFLQIITSF